jgi:(2S)-methylsuccinyl-CoA dehydrogenase
MRTYLSAAQTYRDAARATLATRDQNDQRAAHGFAWVATSLAAL